MKQILSFLNVLLVLTGCQNLNLLDEMEPWDGDTETSGSTSIHSTATNESEEGDSSKIPQIDEADTEAPKLVSQCVNGEILKKNVCISHGPFSAYVRILTDEPAEILVSLQNKKGEDIAVLSKKWGTEHEVLVFKLAKDVETTVLIQLVDINGNVASVDLMVTLENEQPIVVSEVLADPLEDEPSQEFVEVVNVSPVPLDVSGWMIDDNGDKNGDIISDNAVLEPRGVLVLASDKFEGINEFVAIGSSIGTSGLKNSESESVELYDAEGTLITSFSTVLMPNEGVSIERRHLYLPDEAANVWQYNLEGTSSPGK